jgi:peptide/nickel transport system substrate-binding protein
MNKVKSVLWLVTLLAMMMGLMAACVVPTPVAVETEAPAEVEEAATEAPEAAEPEAAEPEPAAEQVLRIGQVGDIRSLEPYRNAAPNFLFIENVFDQLLFNEKNQGLMPEAAESVELAPDNMSVTIKLRPDMVTHDGSPVDAEMLKWDLEERVTQEDKGVAMYQQVVAYYDSSEVIDDLTLQVNFKQPAPHALDLMALMIVADPDMFLKGDGSVALGNEEETQIGSGAFKMAEYVPGSHMYLERNEDYWEEGAPKLEAVEIRYFGDSASMMAALEAGEIDLAYRPPFEEAARFLDNPEYTVWIPETQGLAAILMVNPEREQLNDVRVRQAISYAMDREAINQAAYAGLGTPTGVPVTSNSIAYSPDLEIPTTADPEKAMSLLEEAGATDLQVSITYASNNDTDRLTSEIIAANLQAVGIDAQLNPVERNIYVQSRVNQDFDLLPSIMAGGNKYPSGLEDSFVFAHVGNKFFDDIEAQPEYLTYSDAFDRAMAATDEEEAAAAWQEALQAAQAGAWVDTLLGLPFLFVSTSDLKDVTWTEADKPVFKYSYLE